MICVIGKGARRVAVARRMKEQIPDASVYTWPVVPPELAAGLDEVPLSPDEHPQLFVEWAKAQNARLVIIVDERLLHIGLSDRLIAARIPVLGATSEVAKLERDKILAKRLFESLKIPTPQWRLVSTADQVSQASQELGWPIYLKASPSLGSVGVVAVASAEHLGQVWPHVEAQRALERSLLAEQHAPGEDLTITAIGDDVSVHVLPPVRIHPNATEESGSALTGGMGASVSPAHANLAAWAAEKIFEPIFWWLDRKESIIHGPLTAGLRVDGSTITLLELNCHMGDPETQCMLASTDYRFPETVGMRRPRASRDMRIVPVERRAVSIAVARTEYPGDITDPASYDCALPSLLETRFHPYDARIVNGRIRSESGRVCSLTASEPVGADPARILGQIAQDAEIVKTHVGDVRYRSDILSSLP